MPGRADGGERSGGAVGARIIVIGNEASGTGKSVLAMQLIGALLARGAAVGSLDLDSRQASLTRHLELRGRRGLALPEHEPAPGDEGGFADALARVAAAAELVIIDTPGHRSPFAGVAHARADLLLTPIGDAFAGLEALARLDHREMRLGQPSRYAEMVWEARKRQAGRGARALDWLVLRNRRADGGDEARMERLLGGLARRLGFAPRRGLGERSVYAELAGAGASLADCGGPAGPRLSMAHVVARQELRRLVEAIGWEERAASSPAGPA